MWSMRSHLIARRPRLSCCRSIIDDTRDDDEGCRSAGFREVQWTRPAGRAASAAFVERVRRLLSGEPSLQADPGRLGRRSRVVSCAERASESPYYQGSWRAKPTLLARSPGVVVALRLSRGQPIRSVEAWRRDCGGASLCGTELRLFHHPLPARRLTRSRCCRSST